MANTKSSPEQDDDLVGESPLLSSLLAVGETRDLELRVAKSGVAVAKNSNGTTFANVQMTDPESGEVIYGTACCRGNCRLRVALINQRMAAGADIKIPVTRTDADPSKPLGIFSAAERP